MLPLRVFPSPVHRGSTGTVLCGTCSGSCAPRRRLPVPRRGRVAGEPGPGQVGAETRPPAVRDPAEIHRWERGDPPMGEG